MADTPTREGACVIDGGFPSAAPRGQGDSLDI
jgi:hypothetical protein